MRSSLAVCVSASLLHAHAVKSERRAARIAEDLARIGADVARFEHLGVGVGKVKRKLVVTATAVAYSPLVRKGPLVNAPVDWASAARRTTTGSGSRPLGNQCANDLNSFSRDGPPDCTVGKSSRMGRAFSADTCVREPMSWCSGDHC